MDEKSTENEAKVPKSLRVDPKMSTAYKELNLKTPFRNWAAAKLWDGIEEERTKRKEPA